MNPDNNNQEQSGGYQAKSIFDSSPSPQTNFGQLPPPPQPKKHLLVIILTISVVIIILLASLVLAVSSAKKQTSSDQPSNNSNDQGNQTQQVEISDSQTAAESFLNNAINNKIEAAKTQTSSQFKTRVSDTMLENLFSSLSGYVGTKSTFKLDSKDSSATSKFSGDDTFYITNSYIFKLANTSNGKPFYVMVNVVQVNDKWLVYGFNYNYKQIKPNTNTNGRYKS